MNKKLLEQLVCPHCYNALCYNTENNRIDCEVCQLGYIIKDDIPIMLKQAASTLN